MWIGTCLAPGAPADPLLTLALLRFFLLPGMPSVPSNPQNDKGVGRDRDQGRSQGEIVTLLCNEDLFPVVT